MSCCFICYGESSVTGTAVSEQYEENAFTQDDPEDAIFNDLALTYNNVEASPSLSETEYDAIYA